MKDRTSMRGQMFRARCFLPLGHLNSLRCALVHPSVIKYVLVILILAAQVLFVSSTKCPKEICKCASPQKGKTKADGLEVTCEGAGLLDIFTQLDSKHTEVLLLNNVKGFAKLRKFSMIDLQALNLQKLRITNSGIKEIQNAALSHLSELKHLDLSQNLIGQLEPRAFEGVEGLLTFNLSFNQLSDMGQTLIKLENLTTLDLSANSLKGIPEGTFTNLSALTYLKLDGTPVRKLYARSFYGLSSLRELSMRDCTITQLDGEMFAFLPHLVTLNLGHNRLQTLPPAMALSGHQFLHSVYFDHNEITDLKANSFKGLNLHRVDLSFNRIRDLGPETFADATLTHVDLSHNLLLTVSPASFTPISLQLSTLSLAGNPLRILPASVFSSLRALTLLNLTACQLSSLPNDVVADLVSLKKLDLSHNNIHFLSEGTLNLLDKLEVLMLSENPWVCDCSIHALRDWLGKSSTAGRLSCGPLKEGSESVTVSGAKCVEAIACAAPSGLLGQQVSRLSEEEFAMCEDEDNSVIPASTQGAIVASCMGFAIVLLIITIYLWRRGKTVHGLKRVCVPSGAESSHKEEDEYDKVPPLPDCRRSSLTNSDHNFVFRHYFDHLVTDPKLMSDDAEDLEEAVNDAGEAAPLSKKERDSQYSSQNSVYSTRKDAAYGMESTV
ncbi:leucine-rich repeat-containing protein [Elysia marginata]|uniref:Leucine-rich repeat-containing protein n=1 Tax=Elysia marginata TaxID=1093978 RepID=A0AAV4FB91_9GAST|nr:leucine-rich repeat-containing protein [Elysia marginata]